MQPAKLDPDLQGEKVKPELQGCVPAVRKSMQNPTQISNITNKEDPDQEHSHET